MGGYLIAATMGTSIADGHGLYATIIVLSGGNITYVDPTDETTFSQHPFINDIRHLPWRRRDNLVLISDGDVNNIDWD